MFVDAAGAPQQQQQQQLPQQQQQQAEAVAWLTHRSQALRLIIVVAVVTNAGY